MIEMKAAVWRYRQKSRSGPQLSTPMHQFSSSSASICLNFDFSICNLVTNCEFFTVKSRPKIAVFLSKYSKRHFLKISTVQLTAQKIAPKLSIFKASIAQKISKVYRKKSRKD